MRTWRSAPWATSETAEAISPTARPASWEVAAMSREALPRLVAVRSTWPTSSRRLVVMAANERPSASRSDFGSTVTVRSPAAIRSAARADLLQVVDHRGEGLGGVADLVVAGDRDGLLEVAAGDALGGVQHLVGAARQRAREQEGERRRRPRWPAAAARAGSCARWTWCRARRRRARRPPVDGLAPDVDLVLERAVELAAGVEQEPARRPPCRPRGWTRSRARTRRGRPAAGPWTSRPARARRRRRRARSDG